MKVLFLTNIPSPYRVDFFNELGKECQLTVLYERKSANDRDCKWKANNIGFYKEIFLKGIKFRSDSALCFSVIQYLNKKKFDIIIVGGYSTPTGLLAIEYMKLRKISFILNIDGGLIKKDKRIKYKFKKHFISSASFWLSSGNESNKFLVHYGADKNKFFIYPFTSLKTNDILDKTISDIEKDNIKRDLKIKEDLIILSVGQFIPRKGYDILLKACTRIDQSVGVYIVGGELTQEYAELKDELLLGDNIHFVGFKSKKELKKYYKASDLFVLPTREDIWGLVINEAMACGLPVITTDKCMAGLELVKNSQNGFIIPIENSEQLLDKINIILSNDALCNKMSFNSLNKIKHYTIENMAKRHIEIFNEILGL